MVQKVFFYWKLGPGWTSHTQNFPDCQQINESVWLLVSLQLSMTQASFFFLEAQHLASHSSLAVHPVALNALSPCDPSASPPVYAATHHSLSLLPAFHLRSDSKAMAANGSGLPGDGGLEWCLFCWCLQQLCLPIWLYLFTHTQTTNEKMSLMAN